MSAERTPKYPRGQRRRVEARREARAKTRQQRNKRRFSIGQIVGALLTAAAVVGIAVYAIVHAGAAASGTSSDTRGVAATVPNDYNPAPNLLRPGTKAPNFNLPGVNGKTYTLSSQRGHTVVLEFFAVWCPHCQHEAPIMERVAKKYVPRGVTMWTILASPYGPNYDKSYGTDTTPATKQDVRNFARIYGEHLPQLINRNFRIVNEYGAGSYPTIYVINKQGVISYAQAGDQPYGQLASAIQSAK